MAVVWTYLAKLIKAQISYLQHVLMLSNYREHLYTFIMFHKVSPHNYIIKVMECIGEVLSTNLSVAY